LAETDRKIAELKAKIASLHKGEPPSETSKVAGVTAALIVPEVPKLFEQV
jgi:hypothetical protein